MLVVEQPLHILNAIELCIFTLCVFNKQEGKNKNSNNSPGANRIPEAGVTVQKEH